MNEIIRIENLTHTYGEGTPFRRSAVENLSLDIYHGEFLGLIGHTGSGKSTLIQHLNGLLKPTGGRVLLDGAHNDPGVRALCGYLDRWMPKENTVLISAMMRDKETEKMCQRLAARVRCVVCTQPNNPRAMPAGELAKEFEAQGIRAYAFAHVKDALEEARRLAGPEGNVVCAGSLYLIGEMRTVLREERDKR